MTGECRGPRACGDAEGGCEAVPEEVALGPESDLGSWAVPGRCMRWRRGRAGAREAVGMSRGGGSFNGGRVHGKDG